MKVYLNKGQHLNGWFPNVTASDVKHCNHIGSEIQMASLPIQQTSCCRYVTGHLKKKNFGECGHNCSISSNFTFFSELSLIVEK
jgi:hypothetical protein